MFSDAESSTTRHIAVILGWSRIRWRGRGIIAGLRPDIGGILDLTNLSSVLDGFNNPIGGLGIFVLENLWIITGIIFIVMLIYNRKIVTMLLNSFIFFTELCFFILHFIYLLFLKKPYLYILRFVNDIKNRRFFQRICGISRLYVRKGEWW